MVGVGVGGAAGIGDHAAIDVRVHRLVAGVLLGVLGVELLEGRGIRRSGLPLPDREVGGLAEDLFGLLQVDAGQFDDDSVLALRPDDRLRVAAAVDAALDDRDRDVAGCRVRYPGPHVGDLELEVRAALQVESLVDVDLLLETQEGDGKRRNAADRAGQRLIRCQPVDVGEPVDEEGNHGNDGNQCQESTIDAHAREV